MPQCVLFSFSQSVAQYVGFQVSVDANLSLGEPLRHVLIRDGHVNWRLSHDYNSAHLRC